jgi:hypothetical protein
MPGRIAEWPSGWPSFTAETDHDPSDKYQEDLKREIIQHYGPDALYEAWTKTCASLKLTTERIAKDGANSIPVFDFNHIIDGRNDEAISRMKAAGCFIVRDVVPHAEVAMLFKELRDFVSKNDKITGWPVANPAIFHLYNSPVQLKLRTHPNQLKLQRLLNSFFSDSNCTPDELAAQNEPILYPDALRIREPGQEFLGLGPHVDAGSISRWANPSYRNTYNKILSGQPEAYDPYDLTHRRYANAAMFPSGVHCTVLRTFQGWTALTPCGPGEGGLMLLPDIRDATAYMMLRPFFKPPKDGQWRDAEKWELDESSWFPGAKRWDSQSLSLASHPHLDMERTLLSVPQVLPGDTIWWHADVSAILF